MTPGAGAALRLLAAAGNARAVVEIGTGTGVSGVWLLRGMRPDGVLTTIDVEVEHQRIARRIFVEAGFPSGRTRIITGRALDVLPRLADGAYDLVFVDAEATGFTACVDAALRLLRPGGVLALNGALAGGRIGDPAARDLETVTVRETIKAIRESEHWIPALLPVGARPARRREVLSGLTPRRRPRGRTGGSAASPASAAARVRPSRWRPGLSSASSRPPRTGRTCRRAAQRSRRSPVNSRRKSAAVTDPRRLPGRRCAGRPRRCPGTRRSRRAAASARPARRPRRPRPAGRRPARRSRCRGAPCRLPSATAFAPVRVARSTSRSGASSRDRVRQRVGEHQPALGVGVVGLAGQAAVVADRRRRGGTPSR